MTYNNIEEEYDNLSIDSLNYPFVLNKHAGNKITSKEEIIQQLKVLHLHGVNTPLSPQFNKVKRLNYLNIYLIPVFQQKILAYYKQTKKNTDNWINSTVIKDKKINVEKVYSIRSKGEERKVNRMAIRAVYALNLDYALVKVGVTAGSKAWILFVNPFPEANDDINFLFEEAIDDFRGQWEDNLNNKDNHVVLGADPEFILQSPNGNLVLASNYLPKKGIAGCDQIWTNQDRSQLPIAELRPTPSPEPRQLTINLYKSLLLANKKITDKRLRWLAGSLPVPGFPIGGHIHFSKAWLNSFLLRALDNYLTLPITLLEDKAGIGRRPKYGFLGDYREQFHGGFEYRTLPSWLVSPTITKAVFALAKIISESYIYLYQNPLSDLSVQIAYYKGDKETLGPIVKKLWEELKQLSQFSTYGNYLYPFEELLFSGYTWNEKRDIRSAWLMPPLHK